VITLGPDAMFSLFVNHAFGAEAMAIARMFDWKSIQAQINSRAHVEGRTADGFTGAVRRFATSSKPLR